LKLQRSAVVAIVVLTSISLANTWSDGATSSVPVGLPIYQFVDSGSGPLPWNALSLESLINHTTMLGGPHTASNATEGVVAYRTNRGDLALLTQSTASSPHWTNLSSAQHLPAPAADPIPFFDPSGNVDLLYVDSDAHVILLSQNDPVNQLWHNLRRSSAWRAYVPTDLSDLSGVVASNGLASIVVNGLAATVAYRTAANGVEVLALGWGTGHPVPFLTGNPGTVAGTSGTSTNPTTTSTTSSTTTTIKPTTTTTKPPVTTTTSSATTSSTSTTTTKPVTTTTKPVPTTTVPATTAIASDPIVLPGAVATFATTTNRGDLVVYTNTGATLDSWSMLDVTTLTQTPKVSGTVAVGFTATAIDVAALTSNGAVELYSSPLSKTVGHAPAASQVWSALNVTGAAPGAPPLSGSILVSVTPTRLTIAGQAANWGDLFAITNTVGTPTWAATDVSVTAGSAARTVGGVVAGLQVGSALTLYAAGVSSPPPQGVGVYAIPWAKWGQAISDGWPIISETGGLGTQSSPWVGFTSTKRVAASPDFLIGQSIYNAHKRVSWLSFWTASGAMASEPQTTTTFYNHGFAAGAWVATQIDQYRGLGVGLKPDWVIFDPEGYPDNHSGVDAPGGSSSATIARYATYWKSMLTGWAAGITSVDASLNAGVYASQSEYRNYGLSTAAMPVFVAVAFGNGGPIPVAGASGSNIRGFIAFSATCTPKSVLKAQESTLLNPPWAGQFNTLQFNAGVYCPPA
jgi:hypothetical protein